ncbi:MAG: HpcH/HpaI aldolase/citrate lyase family protein [Proteobacteria bacterium]|nr:HpcH/HpaI aldolase/citrate lyase family protein [Pseudomonadota bacterium]
MRDDLPRNNFKRAIAAGTPQIGLWLTLASPVATEAAAGAGFDWLLIDMEHAANDLPEVVNHLRAAEGGTAEPIVRVPWNEPVTVKRVLDVGARSLLFPFVQSAEEARRAVQATRYPPKGIRGLAGVTRASRFGRVADYFNRAESEICVLVQVETRKGVDAIEDIAKVDGVDGIFIGPADLSADLGHPGNWQIPAVWNTIIEAGARIKKAGKSAGFLSAREDDCRRVLAAGFGYVAVGTDLGIIARQSEALVKMYKG